MTEEEQNPEQSIKYQKVKEYKCRCGCGQKVEVKFGLIAGHLSGIEKRRQSLVQNRAEVNGNEIYPLDPLQTEPEEINSEQKKEPEQPTQPKQYINIKDVQPYESGELSAWFVDATGNKEAKAPMLRGTLMNLARNEAIPTVLILATDGTFLPPFLIAGFIGMYPNDYVFPEVLVEETKAEPELESEAIPDLKSEIKVEPSPELTKAKKESGIFGIFKKKEKPKGISKETKALVDQLNATKSTE